MTAPSAAPTWSGLITALLRGEDLDAASSGWAMEQVMAGEASPAQVAGFLVALRAKGETVAEMTGLVEAMLSHAVRIEVPGRTVDIVGTGGDRAHTVNISTMAAMVVAATGASVVKHGNRAASSACGAADLLEELGVALDVPPRQVAEVAREAGITFCFAQVFHPAMRHAAVPRRELGVATAFNFLGPLTNPAQPRAQAVGVFDVRMAPIVAGVLADRGCSSLVFRGDDGLDELTTATTSTVWVVREGSVRREVLDPVDLGIPRSEAGALRGGDAAYNAGVCRRLLAGEKGAVRDAVVLNAAAALVALEPNDAPLAEQLGAATGRAAAAIDDGRAAALLERWVAVTQELSASR
ncbi:MAG: anthranilate phosphoribosyltransferase [Actinomycetota bacterium]|nr:anthranilate phosphoribosyltransferase [Actinomycetota bacterium]